MNNKHVIITAIFLLIGSFNLLTLAFVYYKLEGEVVNYRYSDEEEFGSVQEGIDFIDKMPIQFNITNEYFSNFDNLEEETRETIIMAYALKNRFHTFECGSATEICIGKDALQDSLLLEKFHSKTNFNLNNIKVYIDDYGVYTITTSNELNYYKVSLSDDNNNYRKYSKFSHFKQKEDKYIFYFYEGYYKGNCVKGENLELYDFMTGKVVYNNICNGYNEFSELEDDSLDNLQMYKYELKKDENNKYYLAGFNPVDK